MISCLRQREHRHGCSDEGRGPREGTLGAGRTLSLAARGLTAFGVGLIAGIIRVAALLVEEWLRAVEFALEARQGLLDDRIAMDRVTKAIEGCPLAPSRALFPDCGSDVATGACLDEERGHAVEVLGLKQPAAGGVGVAGASVRLEERVAHVEHTESEPVVNGELPVLWRLTLTDAVAHVVILLIEAVEEVELGAGALLVEAFALRVLARARRLARGAGVDVRTEHSVVARVAQEDAAVHVVAIDVVADALALLASKAANVVSEDAIRSAVALPRHVSDRDDVRVGPVVDHAALEAHTRHGLRDRGCVPRELCPDRGLIWQMRVDPVIVSLSR